MTAAYTGTKIKSPFFKKRRQFVALFCNNIFTFSIIFDQELKATKSGPFIMKFTGVSVTMFMLLSISLRRIIANTS